MQYNGNSVVLPPSSLDAVTVSDFFRFFNVLLSEEGGNAMEFDAVFRSYQGKHWKNRKFSANYGTNAEIIKLVI